MSTATAHAGALGKLKPTSVVGYGLGDFGCNLSFSLATSWLLFYYTDVAGFSAAAMGTMFFVVRLWDAVADVLAGRAVDSVMTRWGKFRPFIMFGAVPLLLINVLTFYVPASFQRQNPADAPLTWGPGVMWAYATYAILGLAEQYTCRSPYIRQQVMGAGFERDGVVFAAGAQEDKRHHQIHPRSHC